MDPVLNTKSIRLKYEANGFFFNKPGKCEKLG